MTHPEPTANIPLADWWAALALPSIEIVALDIAERRSWAQSVIFVAVLAAGVTCGASATDQVPRVWPSILDRINADQARAALALSGGK